MDVEKWWFSRTFMTLKWSKKEVLCHIGLYFMGICPYILSHVLDIFTESWVERDFSIKKPWGVHSEMGLSQTKAAGQWGYHWGWGARHALLTWKKCLGTLSSRELPGIRCDFRGTWHSSRCGWHNVTHPKMDKVCMISYSYSLGDGTQHCQCEHYPTLSYTVLLHVILNSGSPLSWAPVIFRRCWKMPEFPEAHHRVQSCQCLSNHLMKRSMISDVMSLQSYHYYKHTCVHNSMLVSIFRYSGFLN